MAACLGAPGYWLLVLPLYPFGRLFSTEMFTLFRMCFFLLVLLCNTLSFVILEENFHNLYCSLVKWHSEGGWHKGL